jgi:hypothetical protein
VKTVVCVKNPGPIAEVAIKKAAPKMTDENEDFFIYFSRKKKEIYRKGQDEQDKIIFFICLHPHLSACICG